jgi:hypothetical protein
MSDSNRGGRSEDEGKGFALIASIFLCCLITGVLTYAWVNHAGTDGERLTYYEQEAKRNQQAICVGRVGTLLAECLEEQRRASRNAYTTEQDLQAQRDMSRWALFMLVVSTITTGLTLWALWFVRGTLDATLEAVNGTNKATDAVVKSNEIALQSQRPWLQIEANLREIEFNEYQNTIYVKATITNIGKMVAERCAVRLAIINDDTKASGAKRIAETRRAASEAAMGKLPEGRSPYPMLPGQSEDTAVKRESMGLPWQGLATGNRVLRITVFVAVRYLLPGDDIMRETDRAFCLTYCPPGSSQDDMTLPFGIPEPLPQSLSTENVWLRPAGHNRTT